MEELQSAVDELKENQNRMWQNQCQNAASNAQNCALVRVDSDDKWEELEKSLKDSEQKLRLVSLIIYFQNKICHLDFLNRRKFWLMSVAKITVKLSVGCGKELLRRNSE